MADTQRWKKRVLRLGPLIGLMALVLATGCVAFAWKILLSADGKLITDFSGINTYLSVTSTIAATLIAFPLEGGSLFTGGGWP